MQTIPAGGARRSSSDPAQLRPRFGRGAPDGSRRRRAGLSAAALLGLAAVLAGCANHAPVAASKSGPPVYAIDLQGGAAHCNAPKPALRPGKTTPVTVKLGNDGGWCGITVARKGGTDGTEPYAAGLLLTPAAHGTVYIHTVGAATRIDYTPAPGFVGRDSFTVSLLPDEAKVAAQVTVTR